jgi:hypothetical protein
VAWLCELQTETARYDLELVWQSGQLEQPMGLQRNVYSDFNITRQVTIAWP